MAIGVIKLTLGALSTNCFIAFDKDSKDSLVIDPSDSGEFIVESITKNGLKPLAVVASHGHFDHILAATEVSLTLNIPFLMNKKDQFLLTRMQTSSKLFTGNSEDIPPKVNKFLNEKDTIKLGNSLLRIIETPGHTPGSISLYSRKDSLCFTGDLVFSDGSIGRYDFAYSDKKTLLRSIRRILKMPGSTTLYSGHGEEISISAIRLLLKNLKFV